MVTDNPSSGMTRASLLTRARRRDPVAWGELVDLYGPLIAHWCRRCGLDSHASADCVQDVFVAVSGALDRFRSSRTSGSFRAWLWTITSNKIRDHARRDVRYEEAAGGSTALRAINQVVDLASFPTDDSSDDQQINDLVSRGLQQVRGEFAEKTWSIFERTVVDGVLTSQVAQEFGVTPATVRQSRSRILRRLRQQLGDLEA